VVVLGKREVHGNGLRAGAYFQLDRMVLHQQAELLQVVVAIEVGPRQRGFKTARPGHKPITELGNVGRFQDRARHGFGVHTHKGVTGAHMAGQGFTGYVALHGIAQVGNLLVINPLHLGQCGGRVGVAGGGDKGGQVGHGTYCATPVPKQAVTGARQAAIRH